MTKDEIIADLRADKEFLKQRVAFLEAALELAERQRPRSGAERSQRWRDGKRHARDENASRLRCENVAKTSPGGPLGGEYPVTSGEDVLGTKENDEEDVNPLKPPVGDGKRHAEPEPDHDWLSFRETYPRTHRTSWPKAERRWKALSKADRAAALEGAGKYAATVKPEYVKAADGWIQDRRWETVGDGPLPGSGNGAGKYVPDFSGILEFDRFLASKEAGA